MKITDLRKIIAGIVSEEIQKQLPKILSEMYVKKIVNESSYSVAPQKSSVSLPKASNRVQSKPVKKPTQNRQLIEELMGGADSIFPEDPRQPLSPNKLFAKDNPLGDIFRETANDIQEYGYESMEEGSIVEGEAPPIETIEEGLGFDFESMAKLAKIADSRAKEKKQERDPAAEAARIQMMRQRLDSLS